MSRTRKSCTSNILNDKRSTTTDCLYIKKVEVTIHHQLHANIFENIGEMDEFLENPNSTNKRNKK